MAAPTIGRNDPCLCGSGIKFKKCCFDKSEDERRLLFDDIDHPRINEWFFHYHPFAQISAAMILHANLTMPVPDEVISRMTRELIPRGIEEEEQIRKEQNPMRLLECLYHGVDRTNLLLLIKRLLEYEEQITPKLLEMLWDTDNDILIDQGARYLHRVKAYPLASIMELADKAQNPYVRSTFCVLLGLKGDSSAFPILWRQYHELRRQYPAKSYAQGPLLGLYEYATRLGLIQDMQ